MITLNKRTSQGFSLIELMIAMVLGLVLMGGVIQVFLTSKQSYAFNEELGWIQENSRFAIEFITRDVRMAGYWGCGTAGGIANTLDPLPSGSGWQVDFNNSLGGFDGDDTGNAVFTGSPSEFPLTTPPAVTSGSVPRSDVLTLSRADSSNSFKVTGHNASSAVITVGTHPFEKGDILIVSDCDHAAVFQETGGNPDKVGHNRGGSVSPGNCTKGLGLPVVCTGPATGTAYTYGDDAFVMAAVSYAYYVDTATNGLPALYVRELGNDASTNSSELVQGIENFQVLYGEDISGDGFPNRYVTAKDVTAWTDVVTARIHILARSLTQVASEPQAFNFVGTSYTPADRFLRQEFVSTVKVRNKG